MSAPAEQIAWRRLPATSRWAVAVLIAQCVYILGFALVWVWWATNGAPAAATESVWLQPPTPYVADPLGFLAAGSAALAAPVAIASIVVAWKALNRAPSDAQAWPEVMVYISVVTAMVLVPLGLLGLLEVLVSLP